MALRSERILIDDSSNFLWVKNSVEISDQFVAGRKDQLMLPTGRQLTQHSGLSFVGYWMRF